MACFFCPEADDFEKNYVLALEGKKFQGHATFGRILTSTQKDQEKALFTEKAIYYFCGARGRATDRT